MYNNFLNKKVLIIGSQGNLGTQLARFFGNEYKLFLFDKNELDVLNFDLLRKKFREIKPDVLINAVAYNAVDRCEEDDVEFRLACSLNGELLGVLADICLELNAVLIHYSSDYVFGADDKKFYKESDQYCPVNKYGETKVMGEKEILARVDRCLKYYIIRTSKLFGPLGASEFCKPSFFDIMLKLGRTKESLDVVDEELSCFTYTRDLARATLGVFEDGKKFGIYHLINEGECTWYQSVLELFKISGIKIKINPVKAEDFPRPAKRPKFSVLKNTKFKKLRNYKDALKEYLDNF